MNESQHYKYHMVINHLEEKLTQPVSLIAEGNNNDFEFHKQTQRCRIIDPSLRIWRYVYLSRPSENVRRTAKLGTSRYGNGKLWHHKSA